MLFCWVFFIKKGCYLFSIFKVSLNSVENKKLWGGDLSKLKHAEKSEKVSVSEDFTEQTLQSKKILKTWYEMVKDEKNNEPLELECILRVRSSPKNGLLIKWLWKRKPNTDQGRKTKKHKNTMKNSNTKNLKILFNKNAILMKMQFNTRS